MNRPWVSAGHAHNDYQQTRPLADALGAQFPSIEIDLFLHGEQIKVSHYGIALGRKPNFEDLYLEPIANIIRSNQGLITAGDSSQIIFMLDLKTDPSDMYKTLQSYFDQYQDLFQHWIGDSLIWGPVILMNSGKRNLETINQSTRKYWVIDGQAKTELGLDSSFVPRMSYSYKKRFSWKGKGEMPETEYEELCNLVDEAHYAGKKIRFWATPDDPKLWEVLLGAGVDWINVDDLELFRKFYFSH